MAGDEDELETALQKVVDQYSAERKKVLNELNKLLNGVLKAKDGDTSGRKAKDGDTSGFKLQNKVITSLSNAVAKISEINEGLSIRDMENNMMKDHCDKTKKRLNSTVAMNDELEAMNDELKAKNKQLEKKNDELKAKNKQLEKKNEELKAKNKQLEKMEESSDKENMPPTSLGPPGVKF